MQTEASRALATLDELGRHLTVQAGENRFSGVVLVAHEGEPLFHEAYGLASKRFRVPNQVDTKFNLGSINKIFTVVSTLQLAEKGLLSLDDPLSRFRSDFSPEVGDRVTVRHLLQQRSGWGDYWDDDAYLARWASLRTVEDYIGFIRDIPLDFAPGEGKQHCNTGYEVLGAIIEAVTGLSYYDYVRANIYGPVGMVDSDSFERDMPVENLAMGYTNHAPPGVEAPPGGEEVAGCQRENTFMLAVKGTPSGGGYSTAADLLRFGWALRRFRLLGPRRTAMIFNRFEEAESLPAEIVRELTFAGAAEGVNTFYGARSARDVIVLSNYDPPVAMELGFQLVRMPEMGTTGS